MKLARHVADLPYAELAAGSVVSIGSFDGLHVGHRQLLDRVISKSRELGVPSIVMSFEPTPKEFFSAANPPARLMRFREKFAALNEYGIDIYYKHATNADNPEVWSVVDGDFELLFNSMGTIESTETVPFIVKSGSSGTVSLGLDPMYPIPSAAATIDAPNGVAKSSASAVLTPRCE